MQGTHCYKYITESGSQSQAACLCADETLTI
jgi:hypothetical protein